MQPAPSPSAGRGDVVIQPAFFTSILYVQPLREDISALSERFRGQYSERDPAVSPFSLFKQLWRSEGWKWLHFKVFDDRARETFLLVTTRIFLEHLTEDDPMARVVGLFGAYTFYYTQPEDTAPKLHRINHIPIPIDHFHRITNLSKSLSTPDLLSLQEPVLYITSTLVKDRVFYILPSSDLGPENPRYLPREVLVSDSSPEPDPEAPKKKGRPSWRDKAKKAQVALDGLSDWLDSTPDSPVAVSAQSPIPYDDLVKYQSDRAELITALEDAGDKEALMRANMMILDRLREAQAIQNEEAGQGSVEQLSFVGVERVERAVREFDGNGRGGGVLGLLEGAWEGE
ncbi:hypothetical protein D9756_004106 [Leucocoprinus leucothites]|uniref:Uncharacterized protein n=1 Tax=Leucocoprinus leucothites TaxID=201217 RepID=A0A8H5DAV6_9AGAR|nr:hypothetical protein D9756_004106 [Leucoagaricus leucothites]